MIGICVLSAVPMRATPSDRSEMVNQLLEGDTFEVLDRQEKWTFVRCHYDGYEGWVDNKQYQYCDQPMALPEGPNGEVPVEKALKFLRSPYLWGGRTPMGIDCSGFTQVVYKSCGVRLLRDASQQETQGDAVPCVEEARPNDLCFFQNGQGRVTHVGIYLGEGRIIHASGEVRIDTLTNDGIWVESEQRYSHAFHSIRRVM